MSLCERNGSVWIMKKTVSLMLAAMMLLSLTACGKNGGSETSTSPDPDQNITETVEEYLEDETQLEETDSEAGATENSNVLVAYFSWADNAILADDVDAVSSPSVIPQGNVQQLAGWVQEETGGLANSVEQITDAAPDAMISDNIFDCYEEEAASSEEVIKAWIDDLGAM